MKNLFSISDLSIKEVMDIINDAILFKKNLLDIKLNNKIVCNIFIEPSTRTHYSFNIAEEKLNMKVINFKPEGSSLNKGESFYDTIKTFEAFNPDLLVIRHSEDNYYNNLNINIPIINAGDGKMNHPTQTLLDLMTIYEEFKTFKNLNVCLVGDINHSRVANSNIEIMKRLNMNCFICCPDEFMDDKYQRISFNDCLKNMDIIMMLRVQNERHNVRINNYFLEYGLTMEKVKLMKEKSIIMHPAPVNRKVEIDDDVIYCDKSRIFKQMQNGVFIRESVIKRSLL